MFIIYSAEYFEKLTKFDLVAFFYLHSLRFIWVNMDILIFIVASPYFLETHFKAV